jgi:hypothetical protein
MSLLREFSPIGSDRCKLDSSTHLNYGPLLHTIARADFLIQHGRTGCEAGLVSGMPDEDLSAKHLDRVIHQI